MPPRKELCRNFARGSCQYGDRCKFLHVSPQQSKPNPFGFGTQAGQQYQQTNFQQQKPNPFGFSNQNSFQSRGASEFGSNQNQFKPFENKWSRSSSSNTSGASTRQPDNQPSAPSHKCTDPDSCKRQIVEDFQQERPLWRLTCYGHCKNGPCDIVGDISYEELRAAAYDDAKRGLSLQSIVERERGLVNSKLQEIESLLHSPYKGASSSGFGSPNPFLNNTQTTPVTAQSTKPLFSSFNQLGASLNTGTAAPPNNSFGQSNLFQSNNQSSTISQMNNLQFQNSGVGSQAQQKLQSPLSSSFTSFSNSSKGTVQNQLFTSPASSQIPGSSFGQSSSQNLLNTGQHGVRSLTDAGSSAMSNKADGDDSIWMKQEWRIGEIPEEAPPEMYCR